MWKLIVCCVVVASGIQAQAQTPAVVGVANEGLSSPTVSPGSIGYVFGSNFGTAGDTTITVGGFNAQVLAVSGNQIRVLFPPKLEAGLASLTVTVDGKASEAIHVIVSARAPGRISVRRGSVSAGRVSAVSRSHLPETPVAAPSLAHPLSPAASSVSGIVYTCDSTINTASATACNTLNTTIAALYSSAFSNANSSIYVKLGDTDLGMSDWVTGDVSYSNFRDLLIASESDPNDYTAVTDSVPSVNPYGSYAVELPNSLQRALGFGSPTTGIEEDATTLCALGTAGCYDGVITISNSAPLYFRTGTISGGQYDFFTVVEHESDEVLGTASCALYNLCGDAALPADYYRYHSNETRSGFAAGTNDSCSSSDSTNACFSLDGIHMLQQYNNVNNGDDAGDWVMNCADPLVQDAVMCPGTAGVNISPAAEILVLDVVGYTLANTAASGPLQFYPVAPCRLVDTRGPAAGFNGIAPFSGPSLAAGGTLTIPVQSAEEASADTTPAPCGVIPSNAQSYSMNITVVPHSEGAVDYVSLWPAGSAQPYVATLNDPEGLIVSNAAIVPAGSPSGGISVYNDGPATTDIVVDMNGYFAQPSGELQFNPIAPCRLVDTRGAAAGFNGIEPFSGPSIPAKGTLTIPVQSAAEASANTEPAPCGVIPSGAEAYAFNITAVPHAKGAVDYVSLWPAGSPQPYVATLNDPEGLNVANAAIVPAGSPDGGISVYNDGPATTDVVIDMNGYFAASTALQFYPVAPCRLVDTRGAAAGFNGIEPFSGPSIAAGDTLTIPVQSAAEASADTEPAPCGVIPSSAQAYSVNITVVPHADGAVDYVSLWAAGSSQPFVATLNDPEGLIVSNAAIVPAGSPDGGINVYNAGPATTDIVIDMNGYFAAPPE